MTQNPFKKLTRFGLVLTLVFLFSFGCEKDDICVDGDTPLMIVVFRDSADTTLSKPVNSLRVIAVGQEFPVATFSDRTTTDSITLPLNLEADFTEYIFISDSADENDTETGNRDTVRFTYNVSPAFISRACGFVGQYEGVNINLNTDTLNWIDNIEVLVPNITKQDSTHVQIFH